MRLELSACVTLFNATIESLQMSSRVSSCHLYLSICEASGLTLKIQLGLLSVLQYWGAGAAEQNSEVDVIGNICGHYVASLVCSFLVLALFLPKSVNSKNAHVYCELCKTQMWTDNLCKTESFKVFKVTCSTQSFLQRDKRLSSAFI